MLKVYSDPALGYEKGDFPEPRKRLSVEIDCTKYSNPFVQESDSIDIDSLFMDEIKEDEIF